MPDRNPRPPLPLSALESRGRTPPMPLSALDLAWAKGVSRTGSTKWTGTGEHAGQTRYQDAEPGSGGGGAESFDSVAAMRAKIETLAHAVARPPAVKSRIPSTDEPPRKVSARNNDPTGKPVNEAVMEDVKSWMGEIGDDTLNLLSNCSDGSNVIRQFYDGIPGPKNPYAPGVRAIHIWSNSGDGLKATRKLYYNPKNGGKLTLENVLFRIDDDSPYKGSGAAIFAAQVAAAGLAEVDEIKTLAARDEDEGYIGYYVWARCGYDGQIPDEYLDDMPPHVRSMAGRQRSIFDLMSHKEGRDWWKDSGGTMEMTFDPSEGSRNVERLNEYMAERLKKS